jgi:hypothetical protein
MLNLSQVRLAPALRSVRQTISRCKMALPTAAIGTATMLTSRAYAAALGPVTAGNQIIADTVLAVTLPAMTACWGYVGIKHMWGGQQLQELAKPLWGGVIAGGAAAFAAAYVYAG